MADQDNDLAEAIRELTRTLEEVGEELRTDQSRSPFRGPSGSSLRPPLRPPTPREFLAFTDEVALPALLAALESSVRTLEAFQRGIRLVRTERDARDQVAETASVTSDRATDLRRTTLGHLDTVLAELQRATSEGTIPADDRARELLAEARELRDDVDDRLRRATETEMGAGTKRERESSNRTMSNGVRIDVQSGAPDHPRESDDDRDSEHDLEPDDRSAVDVDAEIETLKDRYGQDEDDAGDDGPSSSNDNDVTREETDDDPGGAPAGGDANDADDEDGDEDDDSSGDTE